MTMLTSTAFGALACAAAGMVSPLRSLALLYAPSDCQIVSARAPQDPGANRRIGPRAARRNGGGAAMLRRSAAGTGGREV